MPNGIDLLIADHRRVDELFTEFDATNDAALVGRVVAELRAHDDAEHAALYPLVGRALGDADVVERTAAAHSAVKKQIEAMAAFEGPALVLAVAELRALVSDHVAAEEGEILPALAAAVTPADLDALGARLLQAKQRGG